MDKKEYVSLIIPKLHWDKQALTPEYGELIAQPLEPGFGITLGNAIRRVLLGGIEGAAVTSVIIKGVNNEFSSIPGVLQDTMQVLLNIKGIIVRNTTGQPGTMRLQVRGAATATVADIKADDHLELINSEHVLADVGPDADLDITFFVHTGRGYQAAQWPAGRSLQEDDRIYLDAMFTPVTKVVFDTEKTRVGDEIDYDKLTLKISTDGSLNPLDALHYAISVLRTQLEHFLVSAEIPFNEISAPEELEVADEAIEVEALGLKGVPVELLMKPIDELELSVRAHNCLKKAGLKRILDLVNLSDEESLKIKNFGRKSLNEVRDSMKSFGLMFGMNISEDDIKRALKAQDKDQ